MTIAAFVVLTGEQASFPPSKRRKRPGTQKLRQGIRLLSHAVIPIQAMQNRDGSEWKGEDPESGGID